MLLNGGGVVCVCVLFLPIAPLASHALSFPFGLVKVPLYQFVQRIMGLSNLSQCVTDKSPYMTSLFLPHLYGAVAPLVMSQRPHQTTLPD